MQYRPYILLVTANGRGILVTPPHAPEVSHASRHWRPRARFRSYGTAMIVLALLGDKALTVPKYEPKK